VSAASAAALVPNVSAPHAKLPAATPKPPSVSLPTPSPHVTLPSLPGAPSAPSGVSAVPGASIGSVISSGAAGASPTQRARGLSFGSGGGGSAGKSTAKSRARQRRAASRHRADERALQHDVERLEGCFYALSRFDRRVLALRAGLNGAPPRSRANVARRLDTSSSRIARSERRGRRTLRRTNRSDGCAGGRDSVGNQVATAPRAAASLPTLRALGLAPADAKAAAKPASNDLDRGAVAGESTSSDEAPQVTAVRPVRGGQDGGDDSSSPLLLWFLAALFVIAASLLALRRRGHDSHATRPGAAAAAAGAAGGAVAARRTARPVPAAPVAAAPVAAAPAPRAAKPEPQPEPEPEPEPELQPQNGDREQFDTGGLVPPPPWESSGARRGARHGHSDRLRPVSRRNRA
jgi:hypothetical protein